MPHGEYKTRRRNYEDGLRLFSRHILKTLGIDYEFVELGPTELVELTIHSMYMDFYLSYQKRNLCTY